MPPTYGCVLTIWLSRVTIVLRMIQSFGDRDTRLLGEGICVPRLRAIASVAAKRLAQLESASSLNDLMIPKGNRLEKLGGRLSGYYSIRINDQWRIIFRWLDREPHDVAIVDYH